MKIGQSSIEFMIILTLVLLASSILLSELNQRTASLNEVEKNIEAQSMALLTAHKFEAVSSNQNLSLELNYPSNLDDIYFIDIGGNTVNVSNGIRNATFYTGYSGDNFSLNTSKSYTINFNDSVQVG